MDKRWMRLAAWVLVWLVACAFWWWGGEPAATASSEQWTVPTVPPVLPNPGFECGTGYYTGTNPLNDEILIPNGWTLQFLEGSPRVSSTRIFYIGGCHDGDRFIEKLGGNDSFLVRSQDIETLPQPGKPFDVVISHQLTATYGAAYSLSAWMTSKCGNQNPVDCPAGNYIAKMVGIDPYGGADPNSPNIVWVEDRDNQRWQNLYTSVTALTNQITIFARMKSPFQFHGNLGFMDEFSLIRSPLSALLPLPAEAKGGSDLVISWVGQQSEDVEAIPSGNYDLLFDVQARSLPGGDWDDLVIGTTSQFSTTFQAPCVDTSYQFRVRARAEQPEDEEGAFPNQRYPGVWSKPETVFFSAPITTTPSITTTPPISVTPPITPDLFVPFAAYLSQEGC